MRTDFVRVFGTVSMLEGLEYHHEQSLKCLAHLSADRLDRPARAALLSALDHEAVAYLGRAGQFVAFARSEKVLARSAPIPKLLELKFFRDKFAAHRSIDAPRGEDLNTHLLHAMSVTTLGGYLLAPKHPSGTSSDPSDAARFSTHYLVYQVRKDDKTVLRFSIERDHGAVISEAYGVLERLFLPER